MYHTTTVEGRGLHGGRSVRVSLVIAPGPVRLAGVPIPALVPLSGDRSTLVRAGGRDIGTVEHLFAALGAAGIREGVAIDVDGPELPILDGGARTWCEALVGVAGSPPPRILRAGSIAIGDSRYDLEPGDATTVEVTIDFGDARLAPHARWDGDRVDFAARIAPARTFGFAHEVEALLARGLAQHVAPESVVVVAPDVIHAAGAPFTADEPARHKLLDLVGDLYLHGGPFHGTLRAYKPGHAATHAAMREARTRGLI